MLKHPPTPRRALGSRKVGRHRIRREIERMILDGRFRPGEKLVQSQLAKKFGVSQGLVREALFELKEGGLVETSDNRGMFVRTLDDRSIREILIIREVFDGVSARECCGRASAADVARLHQMADEIFNLAVAGQEKKKAMLDRQFHLEIARLADNRILLTWSQQHHVLGKVFAAASGPEETLRGHHAIVDAIAAGDRNQAENLAREHVRAAWPTLVGLLTVDASELRWVPGKKKASPRRRSAAASD
jgi:DNA-binding GntR family transcriptional regulator